MGAAVRREFFSIYEAIRSRWCANGLRGFTLAIVISAAVLGIYIADHTASGHSAVAWCCSQRAEYPWWQAFLRLPGSMVAPAPMLPVWGSLIQVALVFTVAEAVMRRRAALGVALLAHLAATISARVFIWLGPTVFTGLPHRYLHVLDTGPSAATVALVACLVVLLRAPILGTLVLAGMLSELWVRPDLAGREHIVALVVGVVSGVALRLQLRSQRCRKSDRGVPSPADLEGFASAREGSEVVRVSPGVSPQPSPTSLPAPR